MTYLESYKECKTIEELKEKAKTDAIIVYFLGNNPDRVKAIEDAMNLIVKEKGWVINK